MKVEKRTESLQVVRKMKKVPGVLFGRSIDSVSIQMDEHELLEIFKKNGLTQTFTVTLGKTDHSVYIKHIQKDIINRSHILNVELLQVEKGDMISAKVPLHIIGRDIVERAGFIVQIVSGDIEVEYEAGSGVARVDVDITNLKAKDAVRVRDVKFPAGIRIIDDPDQMLIHVTEQRAAEVVEEPVVISTEEPVVEEPKAKVKEEK
ncbi:MAG TPA: 50S ribosomal protein L25 [Acholeplasmatales bacterium]|nr:50S ribosomal protein L25 [Acholeplasmatales bacterium]